MELRPAVLLLVCLLFGHSEAYSKYGRSCNDIGCLSSETCVMAHDSCSYNQRENKDCGRYPTCRKNGAGSSSPGASLNPMPENTRPVASNYNPNYNNQNPASAPQSPYPNIYPQIPSGNTQYPQNPYPGQYPQNPGAPQGYPGQYPGYQQPYPQQPYPNQPYPNQPQQFPNQNPYGGANPFGNQFPNYRNIPTTTEPSLWNQSLTRSH